MASTPQQIAEIIARNRMTKAMALAHALEAKHFTLDQVRSLTDHGWHIVAADAGTKPPSSETVTLVVRIFEAWAIGAAARAGKDPFAQF